MRLFDRDKNRLSPTREGLQLGPEIRAISDRLQALKTAAIELENGRSRDLLLRLAFPASLSATRVPAMIRDFLAANGPVRIEIASGSYLAIERLVADGGGRYRFRPPALDGAGAETGAASAVPHCLRPSRRSSAGRAGVAFDCGPEGQDLIVLNRERPVRHQLEALFYQHVGCASGRCWRLIRSPAPVRSPPRGSASRWSATSLRGNMQSSRCVLSRWSRRCR